MIVLVLGGARSGKSAVAEALASRLPQPVTYLATLRDDRQDDELAERIRAHRDRRPASWPTVEAGAGLPDLLGSLAGTVLLDSLGPWVAGHRPGPDGAGGLTAALAARPGDTVVVSDEVGLSVHPSSAAGRAFRDELGTVNAAVGTVADEVLLVVAGRVLRTEAFDPERLLGI